MTAAVTDAWEETRRKIAEIFGRGRSDRRVAEGFDATRAALATGSSAGDAGLARAEQTARWTARLLVLLEDHPDAAAELSALVAEIRASSPAAAGHSVAAGRDVTIIAGGGGVAAGVIHGDVSAGPSIPGPASS